MLRERPVSQYRSPLSRKTEHIRPQSGKTQPSMSGEIWQTQRGLRSIGQALYRSIGLRQMLKRWFLLEADSRTQYTRAAQKLKVGNLLTSIVGPVKIGILHVMGSTANHWTSRHRICLDNLSVYQPVREILNSHASDTWD